MSSEALIPKALPVRLETPEDLQTAINAYFTTCNDTTRRLGVKRKKGTSGENFIDTEEYTEAQGIPTVTGLMLHLGLLQREWTAMQTNPVLSRICEVALMRIDQTITELSLQGACDTTFSKDYLKKDLPSWQRLSANLSGKGQLAGANFNGPVKIEISVVRNDKDPKETQLVEEANQQQLEEMGLGEPVTTLKLGLNEDSTMAPDSE